MRTIGTQTANTHNIYNDKSVLILHQVRNRDDTKIHHRMRAAN
jgi:hypothetical protein